MSAVEPIDPALVPTRTLASGDRLPAIGLGTFGSDHVAHSIVGDAVSAALRLGYRHIDCASVYDNEVAVGAALRAAVTDRVVTRDELWISSKVWNDQHGPGQVAEACEQTLRDLGLDHLDNYLVHWPFPNHHPPGCDIDERNPDAVPYLHERFLATWQQMEELVDRGLVRNIGTSNMTVPKLSLLLPDVRIRPSVNQMELHPHFQQPAFFSWLRDENIQPIGFCPIGSPQRPERDTTPEDSAPTEDAAVVGISERLGVHPAVVCVKWAEQRGQIPIPFSTTPRNMAANLQAVTTPPLTDADMQALAAADRNCRLIKGQVFLWRDGQPWTDLWDEDGTIPS